MKISRNILLIMIACASGLYSLIAQVQDASEPSSVRASAALSNETGIHEEHSSSHAVSIVEPAQAAALAPMPVAHAVSAFPSAKAPVREKMPASPAAVPPPFVIPARITIPAIGLSAAVEGVGYDGGNMAVPQKNIGWFTGGARPGDVGSAVLGGHVETFDGKGGVFKNLSKTAIGDAVTVADPLGASLTFKVTRKLVVPYDMRDTSSIFGPTDSPMLNLITCYGTWLPGARTFDRRLIVFAELER